MPHGNIHQGQHTERSKNTNAYLVGGGIASLAAAVHLIQDAAIPANQIHIIESGSSPGGSMDGAGDSENGYVLRGGRMLNFSYLCTYDLLSIVPSLTNPSKTVKQELDEFNAVPGNKTHAHARLVSKGESGPEILNVESMGLSWKDREELLALAGPFQTEKTLGAKRIDECFDKSFFQTKFWFAFEPWHSAVEFRRYLHRFIQEFPRINTLAGVDRTPYNQYDSVIQPIETYLKAQGVDFRYETKVTSLSFRSTEEMTVSEIHFASCKTGATGLIHVELHDVVMVTLGSMTACSSVGSNTSHPKALPTPEVAKTAPDGSWELWSTLANSDSNPQFWREFGNPTNFYSRVEESNWLSFTVTLKDPSFIERYETWSGDKAGTGALVTFKDSAWLMSIVVPHQPHFLNQEAGTQVFWGYGLFPAHTGDFVKKPMSECSGEEILKELLGHLQFPEQPTLNTSITIPSILPYITSQFLTRNIGDRPPVIPKGSTNLALLGQYVEIPEDTVFTVEYSVRAAQIAVHELMGTKRKPKSIYKGAHNVKVLAEALRMLLT